MWHFYSFIRASTCLPASVYLSWILQYLFTGGRACLMSNSSRKKSRSWSRSHDGVWGIRTRRNLPTQICTSSHLRLCQPSCGELCYFEKRHDGWYFNKNASVMSGMHMLHILHKGLVGKRYMWYFYYDPLLSPMGVKLALREPAMAGSVLTEWGENRQFQFVILSVCDFQRVSFFSQKLQRVRRRRVIMGNVTPVCWRQALRHASGRGRRAERASYLHCRTLPSNQNSGFCVGVKTSFPDTLEPLGIRFLFVV